MKGIFYGTNGNICRKWTRRQAVILTNEAKKGKISRVIQALHRPRQLHIIRFRLWRKLIHYAPRPLPKKASLFGTPVLCDYVSEGSAADGQQKDNKQEAN